MRIFFNSRQGLLGVFLFLNISMAACGVKDSLHFIEPADLSTVVNDTPGQDSVLVGKKGKLRFNLQFTNQQNVDLDLYVTQPGGTTISYADPVSSTGGELDVDCRCNSCERGPNENITWPELSPKEGEYRVWVEYFAECAEHGESTEYILRILRDDVEVRTLKGTLESGKTPVYVYENMAKENIEGNEG